MAEINLILSQSIEDLIKREQTSNVIHTIEQGFVDLNIELNENINSIIIQKKVSFRNGLYNLSEGLISTIYIDLDSPSALGVEELDLVYLGSSSSSAVINQDLVLEGSNFIHPLRLSWGVGEKTKQIPISAIIDYSNENVEEFYFELKNLINCSPIGSQKTTIRISV